MLELFFGPALPVNWLYFHSLFNYDWRQGENANETLDLGAGAIGGTIGAHLIRAGHDVAFVDRAVDHIAAIHHYGLTLTGPLTEFTVPANASTPTQLTGQFERSYSV